MPHEPKITALDQDEAFSFACHPGVPCFNHCCRDLNQALTPYDVLRLKNHLKIGSQEFFRHHAVIYNGESTGLPVASLRFSADALKNCPFVTPEGCQVYAARPSSCRIYPLARALQRSRRDGRLSEHYALIQEPHCKGFLPNQPMTLDQWVASQELEAYHKYNDMLLELIALKNQVRPGPLTSEHQKLTQMAFYDLDTLKARAAAGDLPEMDHDHLKPLPDHQDDEGWLAWSMSWIGQVLFGRKLEFRY